jgi:polyisoprenoid-binding protein YceI
MAKEVGGSTGLNQLPEPNLFLVKDNSMKRCLTVGLLLILLATNVALTGVYRQYELVPGTWVKFTITGLFGKEVKGTIGGLKSQIQFDPLVPEESTISASVTPTTINTGNVKRDRHLKTEDFFYVEGFPSIYFSSHDISKTRDGFQASGILSMHGVDKMINIPFVFTESTDTSWFRGYFIIDRRDFHVGKKSALMGDKVRVDLDIPVLKK